MEKEIRENHEDIEQVMFESFQDEMEEFVKNEQAALELAEREKRLITGHFKNVEFHKEEITSDDMWVWEKIKAGTVQNEDLWALSSQVQKEHQDRWGNNPKQPLLSQTTRGAMLGYLGNKATSVIYERDKEQILQSAAKRAEEVRKQKGK